MRASLSGSCHFLGLSIRTMKLLLLLLLVSLFASDLRPLGDEALVTDCCGRHAAPRGLQTHMVHCWFIQWKRQDQGHCSSRWAGTGIIHCSRSPTTIVFLLKEGKPFPEFLASDTLPGSCCISGDTSTVNKVKKCLDSLHRPSAASGSAVQAFLLVKPGSGATATTAPIGTVSCCLKEGEAKSAITMKKIRSRRTAGPQTGQKDDGQQARDIKHSKQDDGQHPTAAAVDQRGFGASAPNSGSSSMKTSDLSELATQRNAAGHMKTNEHLNLDDEPSLQKSPREQLFVKSASRVDDDDDGFHGNRQILVSREKEEATARQLYNLRPAWDNNKEFNEKKITQRAELRPPEEESEKLGLRLNTIKHGNEKTSARVLKLGLGEEAEGLITVFLPDTQMETQTDPASARTLTPSTDTRREAAEEPSGRPPVVFFQEMKYILLEMNVIENTLVKDIKSAKSFTETMEEVKETTETIEANSAAHGNMRINHIKQEEKESVISAPPLVKIFQTKLMKADQAAEATAVNVNIKEPTSRMDAFNRSSKWKAEGLPRAEETSTGTSSPEPGTDSEPRCVKCKTRKAQSRTGKLFAGLRMREDVLAGLLKRRRSGAKNADEAPTNRPGNGRREDDPGGNSLKCSKPLETGRGRAPATDEPACRGLIHRTAAGWKHCVERLAGARTRQPERGEREGTPTGDPEGRAPGGDEHEHFYYFDGELRRVRSHFYPRSRRRRGDVPTVSTQRPTHGNLPSYSTSSASSQRTNHQEDDENPKVDHIHVT